MPDDLLTDAQDRLQAAALEADDATAALMAQATIHVGPDGDAHRRQFIAAGERSGSADEVMESWKTAVEAISANPDSTDAFRAYERAGYLQHSYDQKYRAEPESQPQSSQPQSLKAGMGQPGTLSPAEALQRSSRNGWKPATSSPLAQIQNASEMPAQHRGRGRERGPRR